MIREAVLSIDAGGTYYKAALLDDVTFEVLPGTLFEQPSRSHGSREEILEALISVVNRGIGELGSTYRIGHIAFDFPGPFDYISGCARMSHKFQEIYEFPLTPVIREACRIPEAIPIVYHHDLHAFTYGACRYDAGQGYGSVFCITIGTGLGTGCFRDGTLDMKPDGQPKYPLFQKPVEGGILEDFVSNRGLRDAYNQLVPNHPVADAKELELRAVRESDTTARMVYERMGTILGTVLSPLLQELQIEALVIGGQISKGFGLFGPALRQGLSSCGQLSFIGPVRDLSRTTIRGCGSIPVSWYESYTRPRGGNT